MGKTKEADPDLKLWTSRVKIQKKISLHTRGTLAAAAEGN